MDDFSALREHRRAHGFTQAHLAARAGVSRQLVAAVEAGRHAPAVDAALRLARALSTSVEELFGAPPPPDPARRAAVGPDPAPRGAGVAALGGRLRTGAPVRVGRVADRLVAAALPDHGVAGALWARPDGVFDEAGLRLFPGATPAGLVLAGCDPALGIAEAMLDGIGARSLLAISAPTGTALRALASGRLHAAVVHGRPHELPAAPVPVARWHLARWQVGLAVSPAVRARSLEGVMRSGAPFVRRDPAAASQQALDRARMAAGLDELPAGPRATGHLDAARLAGGWKGAAVTTEGAARAFGLRFLALEVHVVEVWVAERWLDHAGVTALRELLATSGFAARVSHFGGYDLAGCGELATAA